MKTLTFPTIAGAAVYAGSRFVFSRSQTTAVVLGVVAFAAVLWFQQSNQQTQP